MISKLKSSHFFSFLKKNHSQAIFLSNELSANANPWTKLKGCLISRLNIFFSIFPNSTKFSWLSLPFVPSFGLVIMKFFTLDTVARPLKLRTKEVIWLFHFGFLFTKWSIFDGSFGFSFFSDSNAYCKFFSPRIK